MNTGSSSSLKKFFRERCERSNCDQDRIRTSDLYNKFVDFCKEKGLPAMTMLAFGLELSEHGIGKKKLADGIYRLGVKLLSDAPRESVNLQSADLPVQVNEEEKMELLLQMSALQRSAKEIKIGLGLAGSWILVEQLAPGTTKRAVDAVAKFLSNFPNPNLGGNFNRQIYDRYSKDPIYIKTYMNSDPNFADLDPNSFPKI